MARAFDASHNAYESGEKARAKELSNEGHAHKTEMERLNREASEWIFRGMDPLRGFLCHWDTDGCWALDREQHG